MEAKQLGLGPFEERFPPITSNTKGWTKFARVSLAQPLSLSLSSRSQSREFIALSVCKLGSLWARLSECISRWRGAHTWKHACVWVETTTSTLYPPVSRRGKIARVVICWPAHREIVTNASIVRPLR